MNRVITNPLYAVDLYKLSHFSMYPKNMIQMVSYIESRGGDYDKTVFFGLQAYVRGYLMNPITRQHVDEIAEDAAIAGLPFDRQSFDRIVDQHGGYFPVTINAVPEGSVIPTKNVLLNIMSNDTEIPWLGQFIETSLLRSVWYPTTVCTFSWHVRQVILDGLRRTSDTPERDIDFKLHDFGGRGASSGETAQLGGLAHLVNFKGTDTFEAIWAARQFYDTPAAGFSIPAAEHSTVTSYGPDNEVGAYRAALEAYPTGLLAVVSDSYNLWNAISNIWGGELKDEVLARDGVLVIRPDSGDPTSVPLRALQLLGEKFGYTINGKGYKVLNDKVRVIQGDGMNRSTIGILINNLIEAGWSIDNIAFGMGGGLLQNVNRDTLKFAQKACEAVILNDDNVLDFREVYKDPLTDPGKRSKSGHIFLYKNEETGEYYESGNLEDHEISVMVPYYSHGVFSVEDNLPITRSVTLDDVRELAKA